MITSIEIKFVKGIETQKFNLRLMPNKPNLLVAPNGFGKTSIATAFASMNRNRITLDDNDLYKGDNQNQPEINLTIEDDSQNTKILTANSGKNDILEKFDVTVIRSGLIPKAKRTYMGGASASLEIQSITIRKVPPKVAFTYKYSSAKSFFGTNGKILPNITEQLKHTSICDVITKCDIRKFQGKRIQKNIADAKSQINQQSGSSNDIRQWISGNLLDRLKSMVYLNSLAQEMITLNGINSETEAFLAALQVVEIYLNNKGSFDAALAWLRYTEIKGYYENLLEGFRSSDWQWAEAKEVKLGFAE